MEILRAREDSKTLRCLIIAFLYAILILFYMSVLNNIRTSCRWVAKSASHVFIENQGIKSFAKVIIDQQKCNFQFSVRHSSKFTKSTFNKFLLMLLPKLLNGIQVDGIFVKTSTQMANLQCNASTQFLIFLIYLMSLHSLYT